MKWEAVLIVTIITPPHVFCQAVVKKLLAESASAQIYGAPSARARPHRRYAHVSISLRNYFTSTVAPASANFFLMFSASSFETPSFTVLGAPSTRSLASFNPRLVTSRTALMTLILLAPTSFKIGRASCRERVCITEVDLLLMCTEHH